jgi:hypothetical protein
MFYRIAIILICMLLPAVSPAQNRDTSLRHLALTIQKAPSDSEREQANILFREKLREYLLKDATPSGTIPDSLTTISLLAAADKSFRIATWIVPATDLSYYKYFGLLQVFDKKTQKNTLTELHDVSDTLSKPQSIKLKDANWYGAVYYKIVPVKKSGKIYYTLLGWKGNDRRTTKKVIDVLAIQNGKIQFGLPIFKMGKTYQHRIIFEFTASASMSLRYEEKKDMIVYDHLSAPSNAPGGEGMAMQQLGPDGSYDALQFKGGRWNLLKDIDIGTDWKPKKAAAKSSPGKN